MVKFHVPRCPSRNINPLLELPKLTPILKRNFYSVVDFVLVFQRGYTRVRAIEIQRCASKSQPAAYFVCTFCRVRVVRSCDLTFPHLLPLILAWRIGESEAYLFPISDDLLDFTGDSRRRQEIRQRRLIPRGGGCFLAPVAASSRGQSFLATAKHPCAGTRRWLLRRVDGRFPALYGYMPTQPAKSASSPVTSTVRINIVFTSLCHILMGGGNILFAGTSSQQQPKLQRHRSHSYGVGYIPVSPDTSNCKAITFLS